MSPEPKSAMPKKDRITDWADREPVKRIPPFSWIHQIVRIVLIVLRETETNRLSLRSGALTYALLLSMVPMLAMSTAVVKGLGGGDQLRELVNTYIETLEKKSPVAPDEALTEKPEATLGSTAASGNEVDLTHHLRSAVDRIFDYVDRTNFATLGTFGMLGIFLSVILVLGQIETAMNTIWHVEDGRSFLRKVADYLTLMVLMPISLNVALAAGTILKSQSLGLRLDRFISTDWLQALLLNGVPILALTITLYIVYIFFPNTKVKTVPTMIGALLGGTLWFVTQNVYIDLQIGVANYNAIYGSFATIPLFLIWMYFGWLFVLLGAQVAFAIQHCRTYRLTDRVAAPSERLSAAFDLCSLVTRRFADRQGTSLDDAADAFPDYDRDLLEQIQDTLISANILHHSQEAGILMPSLPPGDISHHQIIETIMGMAPPGTDGGRQAVKAVEGALSAFPKEAGINIDDPQHGSTEEPV